jgi:20S proteasome subunit alpha 3
MEAINHCGMCLGVAAKDGILLAAEKKHVAKLLETASMAEKIFKLDEHVACGIAGITADANILVSQLRSWAQGHRLSYQEPMPVEQLVTRLCDTKQGYTQYGGLRPFGVSLLYMGYDKNHGFQLYQSDPSGNYGGWYATCIGSSSTAAQSILKTEYKDDCDINEALQLAVKVFAKTLDSTTLTSEKLEFATLTLVDGKPHYAVMAPEKVQALLEEGKRLKKEEEDAEKAKKEAATRKRRVVQKDAAAAKP